MDFKDKEQYAKILEGMSTVAKTYVRISSIKTALTVFLIGYTAVKAIRLFFKKA